MNTDEQATFLMACLESQMDDTTLLTKELDLLMGCSSMEDEIIIATMDREGIFIGEHVDINLNVSDPKSQRDIDK